MNNKELMFGYDKEADVLYISLGKPQKGMRYIEQDPNLVIRVDPATKEIVGITIIDFLKKSSGSHYFSEIPIMASFQPNNKIAALFE